MYLEKIRKGEVKNLSGANLRYADLTGANLRYADLTGANLSGAYLRGADLRDADLRDADLGYANLRGADLTGVNLSGANLSGAYLIGANLTDADLKGSNLKGAYLRNSYLKDIKIDHMTSGYNMECPEEGEFIGYKKADGCLIKLLILEDSKRSSATNVKCRCDKAKVLDIEDIYTGKKINSISSDYDECFVYEVGKIVKVDDFDEDRWNECTTGIHFFMNREDAINY